MHIYFERTGGFGGLRLSTTIDTTELPADQNRALQEAIDAARFFDLPARLSSPAQAADVHHYQVSIEAPGRHHTVEADETAASPALQSLFRQLTQLARTPRGG